MVGMTKDEFVARWLEDARRREEEERDKKRKANADMNDYIAARRFQVNRYLWRKTR